MFIKGKLIVDDESYNILRYENGRYQKVAKNGMAYTNVITNPYIIEIETTSEINLFAWAASKALMKPVKIVLSHPSEMERPRTIQLYDTLCVGYDCYFNAIDTNPMITRLVLSPAIVVENGETIMEQPWKVTDLSQQNNNGQVQQRNNVENNEDAIELLVKKLEGPFTEDGSKKVEELIMGNSYLFKVTEYNDGDADKLTNTQWSVEFNDYGKLKQLKQSDAFEKDGVICFKYTPEKAENIRIYAWCQGASKNVSVDVPVVSFPICVDRVNLPGLNRDLSDIADDLTYGYGKVSTRPIYSKALIDKYKSEYIENGFDYLGKHSLFTNVENENYPIKAIYSEKQMADTEVKLFGKEWMEWYDSGDDIMKYKDKEEYPDEKLFDIFRDKAKYWFAEGKLIGNIDRMIDKFQANKGGVYEDIILSEALINSPNMELYCNNVQDYIAQRLKERKGLVINEVNGINPLLDETVYMVLDKDSQEARLKIGKTTSVPREDGKGNCFFFRPIFGSKEDRTKGTQIATNDIWSTEVKITSITIKGDDYAIDYHVNLWDHFGLDIGDMEAMPNIVPFAKDTFAVWFVLQHLRGYKPFVTKVQFDKSFTGSLSKGMKDRVAERNSLN